MLITTLELSTTVGSHSVMLPHSLLLLYFTSMSSRKEFFFSTSLFSSRTFSLTKKTTVF